MKYEEEVIIIDYPSNPGNLRGESKEIPDSEPIEVDPIKLSTAWIKAVKELKRAYVSSIPGIDELIMKYCKDHKSSFTTGYIQGQIPSYIFPSPPSHNTWTTMPRMPRKVLSERYPIQSDTDMKD